MNNNPVFIILGAGGVPYKISAAGNKFLLLAKALNIKNFKVKLINKINISDDVISAKGIIEGINYNYLSGKKKRKTILLKIIGEIEANIKLIFLMKRTRTAKGKNYLMISYSPLFVVIYYWILTRILKFRLIFSIMEDHKSLARKKNEKIKAYLFWKYGFRFCDGAIPISKYLEKKIQTIRKKLPIMIVPVLADFKYSKFKQKNINLKYFLYCGNIVYYEVIDLIICAFKKLQVKNIQLIFILHGNAQKIEAFINKYKNESNIATYTQLSNSELFNMYNNSLGLLIPIRPSIQDQARFPQKTAEYLASGRPIITNNIGEMQYYFEDKKNAIFAKEYSVDAYAEALQFVINNPELADNIGYNGQKTGYNCFHYESIANNLAEFILSI